MELLEVLTVGLPFCGFKVLAGLSLQGAAGLLLIELGTLDTPAHLAAWNACVILNVLGAGMGRFGVSLRGLSRK